jgi:hypothetical protein
MKLSDYINWARSMMNRKPAEQQVQVVEETKTEAIKPKRTYKKKDGSTVPKV